MFRKKDLERRCVAEVARIRGGTPEDESGQWPDGWIAKSDSKRVPVEVRSGFPELDATAWARAHSQAAAKARKIQAQTGENVSWTVRNGRGIVLDGKTTMPLNLLPVDPVRGILVAISAKSHKYGPQEAASAILVVHQVQWPEPLDGNELARIANHANEIAAPFREIWIVNEFGDPAQRVPFSPIPGEANVAS